MSLVGEELGQGGEGVVWAVPDHHRLLDAFELRIGSPAGHGPWVYKGYTVAPDWDRLVGLVQWFATLPPDKENALLAATVWPQVVLAERATPDGRPAAGAVGILMPRLPDEYFMTLSSLGHTIRKYRAIDYLTWNEVQAGNVTGFEFPTLRQRLGLLRAVAQTLSILHEHGLHFGDINPNNIVLGPNWDEARICLVDCDSVRTGGSLDGAPVNAPGWEAPEGGSDQRTDCYKFTMLALRCLGCSNDMAALTTALAEGQLSVSDTLRQMLLAGLDPDPARRPTIHVLANAFAAEFDNTPPAMMPWALPVPMEHRESALLPDEDPAVPPAPAAGPPSIAHVAPPALAQAPRPTKDPKAIRALQPAATVDPVATKTKKAKKLDPAAAAKQKAKDRAKLAKEAAKQQRAKQQQQAKKATTSRRPLAVVVVLLLAGAAVGYYLTTRDDTSSPPSTTVAAAVSTTVAGAPPPPLAPCPAAFEAYRAAPEETLKLATLQQCVNEAEWVANNAAVSVGEEIDQLCARRTDPAAPACTEADVRRNGG